MDNLYDRQTGALWKDENFDFTNARSTSGSAPSLTVIPGTTIEIAAFNGAATMEQVCVVKELNHDYMANTPLAFHVHWYPTTTTSGNVKWFIDYWITSQAHPETTISGSMSVISAASRTAWRLQTSVFPDIDLGAISGIGCQIHFRFYRNPSDGSDTYSDLAAVATMGYHYQTDYRGSAQRSSK